MAFGLGNGSTAESLGTPPPRKSKRSKLESVGKPDALMIASPTPSVTASVAVPEIEQKDHYQGKLSHLTLDELKPYCKYLGFYHTNKKRPLFSFSFFFLLISFNLGTVCEIDFDAPFLHDSFATELAEKVEKSDGTEYVNIGRLAHMSIPDIRDIAWMFATIIFGGLAIFVQKPLVPAYWLLNQDDLGKHELKITNCKAIVNVPKTNVNTFLKEGQQMAYYLFLLPENCLAYDLETDEEPSHLNRPLLLNGRRLESCSYEVGAKKKTVKYNLWWGHYTFGVVNTTKSRMLIVEKKRRKKKKISWMLSLVV